ncbi:MAG: class I SAM-dependent methyltransferase [Acidimicrobiales bacterium]
MDANAWNDRYETAELVWSAAPNQFVVEVLADEPPGIGLDLACGEGRNAIWLAEQGWTMTGADFSAAGLAKAASLARARAVVVTWVEADAVTWSGPAELDLGLVAYLHLPAAEQAAALANLVAACRPGGLVVVVGHARLNLTEGYGGPQVPAILLEPDEVVADLGSVTVERAEHVTRTVTTDDGDRTAIDTLVVARTTG